MTALDKINRLELRGFSVEIKKSMRTNKTCLLIKGVDSKHFRSVSAAHKSVFGY